MSLARVVRRLSASVVAGVTALLAACDSRPTRPELTITVNRWVGFAPAWIIKAQGLDTLHGFQLNVRPLEAAGDRRAAFFSNSVDIVGSTFDDFAITAAQGSDAAMFLCTDNSTGGDGIIARREVQSVAALRGKRVAAQPSFVNHFLLLYVMAREGLSAGDVTIVPMTPDDGAQALFQGRVDAAATWEPHLTAARADSAAHVLATTAERDLQYVIIDVLYARQGDLESRRDLYAAFVTAWDEATRRVIEAAAVNDTAVTSLVAQNTGIPAGEVGVILTTGLRMRRSSECRDLVTEDRLVELDSIVNRVWMDAGFIKNRVSLRTLWRPVEPRE